MPKSMFPFSVSAKMKRSTAQYCKVRLENRRRLRLLVRNEEVSRRYVRSFYVDSNEMLTEFLKRGTVCYFWEQDSLLAEYTIPQEKSSKMLRISVMPNGSLSVAWA